MTCYICHEKGHIATDCAQFGLIKGNLREQMLKKMKESANRLEESGAALKEQSKVKDFSL